MTQAKTPTSDVRRYRGIARDIVRDFFRKDASRIAYKRTGLTNFVFAINHAEGQFVIRISPDSNKLKAYQKELWATRRVRVLGIPTPEVLMVGTVESGEPYMISRRVSGTEAIHHPNRLSIIHEVGIFAKEINSIQTHNFGESFDWLDTPPPPVSWSDFLDNEWNAGERLTFLEEHEFISKERIKQLYSIFEEAKVMDVRPTLSHGDLRLKNVIVDEDGEITAIIDWEDCLSTFSAAWELSIALHDLSIDEKHAFLDGYGLEDSEVAKMSPLLKAFNIMNYVSAINAAIAENDDSTLNRFRLRLSGALDLYSI
jgi:aminoglycoside phosphotransferase (APT) family kinase protein